MREHGEDRFDKPTPALTRCPVTGLAPLHGRPELTFGGSVALINSAIYSSLFSCSSSRIPTCTRALPFTGGKMSLKAAP